jgi:hypothetical protein
VRGYVDQGTPGVVVDERGFFGLGTTYEVAFDVGSRVGPDGVAAAGKFRESP